MATIPTECVRLRAGAVRNPAMVVLLEESATKINTKASGAPGGGVGLDLATVLSVRAWVGSDVQHGWLDLHVFDECDRLIHSETLPMKHVSIDEAGGSIFGFDGSVYRGTGASPGSVWLAPDAHKLQYRLYAEVDGTVFTDDVLRQHDVPADSALTRCGPPAGSRRPNLLRAAAH